MLINGIEANTINAMDRGLAYGDGVFSTIKVQFGQLQLWEYHLARLQLGAGKLHFPNVDWQQLTAEVEGVATGLSTQENSVIKIMLTRGSGGRGYSTQGCDSVSRIISSSAYPVFYHQWQQQGIEIILCESTLSSNTMLAGLKTLNRLEQVMIKSELERKQSVEGLVCDHQGYVIEACSANVFVHLDGVWQTPKLDSSGVSGVQRRNIIERARQSGVQIIETIIHKDQLIAAKAICLSNALMGLVPVRKYQQQHFDMTHCQSLQSLIDLGSSK